LLNQSLARAFLFAVISMDEKTWLYIIYSGQIDRFYTGISNDPDQRILSHNQFPKGWTKRGVPWKLVFKKEFPNKKTALFWERKIKSFKSSNIVRKIINHQFDWNL